MLDHLLQSIIETFDCENDEKVWIKRKYWAIKLEVLYDWYFCRSRGEFKCKKIGEIFFY